MSMTKEQCDEFWCAADVNNDGSITVHELAAAVRKLKPDVSDKEVTTMFMGLDHGGDKKISRAEFEEEMLHKQKRSEGLINLFKEADKNGDKSLSLDEIKVIVTQCFDAQVVDDVLKKMFEYCDTSGDGKVTFDEFKDFFC
ncbi:hypothetical protein ACF0H5_018908 [Mactra antiquata]